MELTNFTMPPPALTGVELNQLTRQGRFDKMTDEQNAIQNQRFNELRAMELGGYAQGIAPPVIQQPPANVMEQPPSASEAPRVTIPQTAPQVTNQSQPVMNQLSREQAYEIGQRKVAEQQRVAKEAEYQKELQVMKSQMETDIKLTKDMIGEDGDMSPLFSSMATAYRKAYERSGNPYLLQISNNLDRIKELKRQPKKSNLDKATSFPNSIEGLKIAEKNLKLSPEVMEQAKLYLKDKNMLSLEFTQNPSGEFSVKPTERAPRPTTNVTIGLEGKSGKFSDSQYERYFTSGQKREFLPQAIQSYRNVQGKADWDAGFEDWLNRNNKTGTEAGLSAADVRSSQKSYELQVKLGDSIKLFTDNMDGQIELIKEAMETLPAADKTKALAMPWREFQRRFMGSGDVARYNQILQDLSQESSKLGSGATASISAPAVGLVNDWNKIHDKNMPVSEMLKVLKTTKELGDIRRKSQEKSISLIRSRMGNQSAKKPSLEEYIAHWSEQNPAYKNKKLAKWKAAYYAQYGGN